MRTRLAPLVLVSALLAAVPVVSADDGPPVDFITVNPDGTLAFDPSGLTPAGLVMVPPPADWELPAFQADLPGTRLSVCLGCLAFNAYTTASGQTVLVPTAYTAVLMALKGEAPFDATPDYAVMNGALGLAAYAGAFEAMGIDPGEVSDLSRWRLDPRFWLHMNAALNDPRSALNQAGFFWASGLFVFSCDPLVERCVPPAQAPDQSAEEVASSATAVAPIAPSRCPLDLQVTAAPPVIEARKLDPPFPVIVGQDPERRGVDLAVSVTIPPVVVSFNEEAATSEHRCDWVGPGKGTGCAAGSYDNTVWQTWMTGNDWKVVDVAGYTCERRTTTYSDRIRSLQVTAELTPESVAWIEGDLAARYPGAHVYQANWRLYPGLAPSTASLSADGTQLAMDWESIQFRDPGNYLVVIQGATAGTPYTAPRALDFREMVFGVDLVMVGLTK